MTAFHHPGDPKLRLAEITVGIAALTLASALPAAAAARCANTVTHTRPAHARALNPDAQHRWDLGFWGPAYADYNSPQYAFTTSGTAVYCEQAHPGYDASSGTYPGPDGRRHRCP